MKKYFFYSIISAILLVLSSQIYGFWFLSFVAVVPFFYALNLKEKISNSIIFIGGLFLGLIYSFFLFYSELSEHKLLVFLSVLVCGLFFGLMGFLYRKIRLNNILDIFSFSTVWVLFEWFRQIIYRYFDFTPIAYTSYGPISFLSFSSIGGIYLTSLIIVLINAFVVGFVIFFKNKNFIKVFFTTILFFIFIYSINFLYLNFGNKGGRDVSFSSIQISKDFSPHIKIKDKQIILREEIEDLLSDAVSKNTDYIIYPYNIAMGAVTNIENPPENYRVVSDFNHLNDLIGKNIINDSKFVFWVDSLREETGDGVFDEVDFWNKGEFIGYYQKRHIHPFYDIGSQYFRKIGLNNKPYDFTPSIENKIVKIGKDRFSGLNCSELNYSYLSRNDSKLGANIILSVGYSYVFKHFYLGEVNTTLARFRAVETNLPIIKADVRGPSAFIDKTGKIVYEMEAGKQGVLLGNLYIEDEPKKTLYTIWGDYPLILSIFIYLTLVIIKKYQINIVKK